jgi:hypothetical protein
MRFALLMAVGACVGAVAAFTLPMSVVQSTSSSIETVGTAAGHIPHDLADLNPVRLAYDAVMQRVREGNTPEQLGFKSSSVTDKPFVMPTSSFDGGYSGTGIYSDAEDVRRYAQNPTGWHGAPH